VIHQGDIVLKPLNGVSQLKFAFERKDFVVQGERTGHNHIMKQVLVSELTRPQTFGIRQGSEARLIHVEQETELTHPQHETVKVPAGLYVTYRVRDWGQARFGD